TVRLGPGDLILLFTDGLVERRDQPVDRGLERLRRAIVADEPDAVCRSAMHHMVGSGPPADDVAVLALQVVPGDRRADGSSETSGPGAHEGRWRAWQAFPADLDDVASARRFAIDAVRDWAVDTDVVSLLVTELATNAVQHSKTSYSIQIEWDPPVVRIEVTDEGPGTPVRVVPSLDGSHGRGLFLVEALADRWGVRPQPRGKTIWLELSRG
ncbi:MAG: ATP-binding protein, partial [Acidimicrobiales bacterium]|nr:ATP-binding protein [Acidimicrobiales bacterium]